MRPITCLTGIALVVVCAGCRSMPEPCVARIEKELSATLDNVSIRADRLLDAVGSLNRDDTNSLNVMLFLSRPSDAARPYFLEAAPEIMYRATNITVSTALNAILQQSGVQTGIVHEALVLGTSESLAYLRSLPPFPKPANRSLARRLARRWEGEWPPCLGNARDIIMILSKVAETPIDMGYTGEWPLMFVRPGVRDMTIRNLLWWTAAYGGKEIVLTDDGVSFKEFAGNETNSAYEPADTSVSEIALAVEIWPRVRQTRSPHVRKGDEDKRLYHLDLGSYPKVYETRQKKYLEGIRALGWSKQPVIESATAFPSMEYALGVKRLRVRFWYGGSLALAYWAIDSNNGAGH